MSDFTERWAKLTKPSFKEELKENLAPSPPLKPRIEAANKALDLQVSRLDSSIQRLKQKDEDLFQKAATSMEQHEDDRASTYSRELEEVRKVSKTVQYARTALEQTSLRLSTVKNLGDVAATISPVLAVIKDARRGLSAVMPKGASEITEVGDILNDLMSDMSNLGGMKMSFEPANDDADNILAEASAIVEQRVNRTSAGSTLDGLSDDLE